MSKIDDPYGKLRKHYTEDEPSTAAEKNLLSFEKQIIDLCELLGKDIDFIKEKLQSEPDIKLVAAAIERIFWGASERKVQHFIVEITPKFQEELGDFETIRSELKGNWVKFTGWLFYDSIHADEAENSTPGRKGNWRKTAWEVHPVSAWEIIPEPRNSRREGVRFRHCFDAGSFDSV